LRITLDVLRSRGFCLVVAISFQLQPHISSYQRTAHILPNASLQVNQKAAIHLPPTLSLREQGGLELGDFLPHDVKR